MQVLIDYDKLEQNAIYLKNLAPSMIPVIKGNFYGHGMNCVRVLAHHFNMIAVHNEYEVNAVRSLGLNNPLLVLSGLDRPIHNCIPVIGKLDRTHKRFAIFADYGCKRINVRPRVLQAEPELVLVHNSDYRIPVDEVTALEIAQAYGVSIDCLSVGSSMNVLKDFAPKMKPRVGMALTGYSSDEGDSYNLAVVKTVLARVCDRIESDQFGYNARLPTCFKNHFLYSIDVGYYDNLYTSCINTQVHCLEAPEANVILLSGVENAVSMNHSFVVSDVPLPATASIELLGEHVRADYLAKHHKTTIANILRIGNHG